MNDDYNPRSDDARLRALLAAPQAPGDLRERIRANLAAPHASVRRRQYVFAAALLGLVVLAGTLVLAPVGKRTPHVVAAAYDDMLKDRSLRGTFDDNLPRWLAARTAHMPTGVSLDLSKNCTLGDITARHLRLVNPALGRLNVFVYERPLHATVTAASGAIVDHHWLLLELRPGVVALVLYDATSTRDSVMGLITQTLGTPIRT